MSGGGFFMPSSNSSNPNYQHNGTYPSQHTNTYPPNTGGIPCQQPGYCEPQYPYPNQVTGYPSASVGAPPQQNPFYQQAVYPQLGVPYPSAPNLPYGIGPNVVAASQVGLYPVYPTNVPPVSTHQQHNSPFQGGHSGQPPPITGNNVELSIQCTNLKDADIFSKSDPVCVLFEKRAARWVEIGRTEMILNCLNPKFQKKFNVNHNPQSPKELKFEVYDWDNNSQKLNQHDFLGRTEINFSTIWTSPGKQITSSLKNGGSGKITIMAEEININARERIRLQLEARKLDRMDFFGSSDPFYTLSKKMSNGQWSLIYQSEVIKNNCSPRWNIMEKSVAEICNGDYQRELKIEIFDYDLMSKNDVIGEFVTNLRSLSSGVTSRTQFEVINHYKQRNKRGYKNSGTVSVSQYHSF